MEKMVNPNLDFWRGKKVFVTGHTGFKGSWLSKVLLRFGSEVTGYALENETSPNLFDLINAQKEMRSLHGDIRDYNNLEKGIYKTKPDIVFHLAAQPLVRESYQNPGYTYETNIMGTVNLLEALRKSDSVKSIVNVTTDKVYLNLERDAGYAEDEILCGSDPYSNSKSCSELVTYGYRQSFYFMADSPALSTARSGNVIGGGDFAKDRVVPDCVRAACNNTPILVRNPNSVRPYQHILECLSGYMLLAELQYNDKNRYEGAYNFGPDDSKCLRTGDLVDLFCNIWNRGIQTDYHLVWEFEKDKQGPVETSCLKLNTTKTERVLGWKTNWGIEKSLEETINWTKAYVKKSNVNILMDNAVEDYFCNR